MGAAGTHDIVALLPTIIDAAPCGIMIIGAEGQIEYVNQTLLTWLERTREAVQGRMQLRDLLTRAGNIYFQTYLLPMLRLNDDFQEISLPLRASDGSERPTLVAGHRIDSAGRAILVFLSAEERARIQKELARIRETAQTRLTWLGQIEKMANIGAWSIDIESGGTIWSDQVYAIHDLPVGPPLSLERALSFFPPGAPRDMVNAVIQNAMEKGGSFQFETTLRTSLGEKQVRSSGGIELEKGKVRRIVGILEDVTEEAKATEKLWRAAHIDALSGLANRGWFNQRLSEHLAQAKREECDFHLIILDLDHFKEINDAYGHPTGDKVIRIASERITTFFGPDAIIGRIGGDEFAVIQNDVLQGADLQAQIVGLSSSLNATVSLAEAELQLSATIGIARFPKDATNPDELVRCADMALLHAKQTQKGSAALFDRHIRATADLHRNAVERVRQAAAAGRIIAHFQPRVLLETGDIIGYEALARLLEPDGHVSGPAVWGSALNDPDCARLIDQHVLKAALSDWSRLSICGNAATRKPRLGLISLNTSEYSLKRSDFVSDLLDHLRQHDVPTSSIEVEVLETVLVGESNPRIGEQLAILRRAGISVALDDFGTGFASLTHLRDLPIDRIKLDQSFVRGLNEDARNRPIIRAMVDLAHALGMRTVAEGIEHVDARNFLCDIGCEEGQGFLFGKPAALE